MLLLDSHYDDYKGVVCHVAVVDGALRKGQRIESAATGRVYEVGDVGMLRPEMVSTGRLLTGQVREFPIVGLCNFSRSSMDRFQIRSRFGE
jgi:translation elongation factor EF-4